MRVFGFVYLFLLAYVVAALVFWGYSLYQQSGYIYEQEKNNLEARVDSSANPAIYNQKLGELERKNQSRTHQYLGEGLTFLIIILVGAIVVFTSFRRNLGLSRQQNNFMLAVTHELKSPIAAIKLNVETLLKHKLPEDKNRLLLTRSLVESDRLNDLCNNMLLASQIEGRQHKSPKEEVDFSALVQSIAATYIARHGERISILNVDEGIVVMGDEMLIGMAFTNLLENAVKYTQSISPIKVGLYRKKDGCAVLQVCDQGEGISEAEKPKIFQKFYRIGEEGTRSTKGTGLGLYLTRKIVKQHKGKISVKNNVPNGSIFQITLPVV